MAIVRMLVLTSCDARVQWESWQTTLSNSFAVSYSGMHPSRMRMYLTFEIIFTVTTTTTTTGGEDYNDDIIIIIRFVYILKQYDVLNNNDRSLDQTNETTLASRKCTRHFPHVMDGAAHNSYVRRASSMQYDDKARRFPSFQ